MPVPDGMREIRTYVTESEYQEVAAVCAVSRRSVSLETAYGLMRHVRSVPLPPPLPAPDPRDGPAPRRAGRPRTKAST